MIIFKGESKAKNSSWPSSATSIMHTQYVAPQTLQATALRETDNLNHLGIKKTLDAVKFRFHWLGYEAYVDKWIKQCDQCQKCNPPQLQ